MENIIKEINDNLKSIIDNIKENRDSFTNSLENIQNQMDKKVEEAKKYRAEVDLCKDKIRELESDNKSLESSLNELNDKYSKMNLVSVIEVGNKEIKSKINNNNISINKEKEHIAELTNKARTIKDLLINLKKDKTLKEEKLENLKVVYDYYYERINDICDYAFDHSNNLGGYKPINDYSNNLDEEIIDVRSNPDLENTMVFDEIANIDENDDFKDEMTLINNEIDDNNYSDNEYEESIINQDTPLDTTQVFDNIFNVENDDISEVLDNSEEDNDESNFINTYNIDNTDNGINENDVDSSNIFETNSINLDNVDDTLSFEDTINNDEEKEELNEETKNESINLEKLDNTDMYKTINTDLFNNEEQDKESEDRISRINDLFSSIDNVKTSTNIPVNEISGTVNKVTDEIDSAYKDIFGKDINEENINEGSTMTDIFGNPIKGEEVSDVVKTEKEIDILFSENGISFDRFKETEKNYLKQIYSEENFTKIINVLKSNNINIDNIYHAFNIFGEITPIELDNIINKFINVGQSVEAIGLVLEKLPKVKKYDLDYAINSFGDYVKDVDITELIIKAKELYDGGNK